MSTAADRKSKSALRTHNARLAIAILENGLRDGRLAAAQKAAIAVLRSPDPLPETVSLVRFHQPGGAILSKAGDLEKAASACLKRG